MKIRLILLLVFSMSGLSSCKDSEINVKTPLIVDVEAYNHLIELRETEEISGKFEIEKVERTHDRLFVTLKGGCKGSVYSVVWDGTAMLSMPMQVRLLIVNDKLTSKDCEISKDSYKLEIDLKNLIGETYRAEDYIFHLKNGSQIADKTSRPDGSVSG